MNYDRLSEISQLGTFDAIEPVLKEAARYVRRTMVDMIWHANIDLPRRGHYGSSSSSVELCLTEVVRFANPWNDFIAWKPHASPTVYAILYLLGELTLEDLKRLRRKDSPCQAYFNQWRTPLVQVSTGCMGFPLPYCCGRAMGDKMEKINRRVIVNLGDAEFTMPMGIEALRFGAINRLNNYGIVVDDNRQSMSGLTSHLMGDRPLEDYFRFFGWNVIVTEGHDIPHLWESFGDFERSMQVNENPTALVAKTDKWRGLPNGGEVGHHAHMTTLTDKTYRQFLEQNGWLDTAPFSAPSKEVREFFKALSSMLKKRAATLQRKNPVVRVPIRIENKKPTAPASSTIQSVQQSFHRLMKGPARKQVVYVDPDLGKFPGLLPNFSGSDSVEGEMYTLKNPNGFVIRAGLADPFAVAIATGLGREGNRYPIIPMLDGFGLLVAESIRQGSLCGSRFMVIGIETAAWEGLTHQPTSSANTVFRNLPDRPVSKGNDQWETGVHHYYPCHPREARLIFEECLRTRKTAYLKLSHAACAPEMLKRFDDIEDAEMLQGGYVLGKTYAKPDLAIVSCGREVYTCIEAVDQLRKKYPDRRIQLSAINYLNLPVSLATADRKLMHKLIPDDAGAVLRVAGLPLDTLGIARGPNEKTLGTRFLTQSCTAEESAKEQGYDLASVVKAAEQLLKLVISGLKAISNPSA